MRRGYSAKYSFRDDGLLFRYALHLYKGILNSADFVTFVATCITGARKYNASTPLQPPFEVLVVLVQLSKAPNFWQQRYRHQNELVDTDVLDVPAWVS